jgi:hypothetical protein
MSNPRLTRDGRSLEEATVSYMWEIAARGSGSSSLSGLFGSRNERDKGEKKMGRDELPLFFSSLCVAPVPQAARLFAESGSAPVPMFSEEPLDQSDILPLSSRSCMTIVRVLQKNIFFACLARRG